MNSQRHSGRPDTMLSCNDGAGDDDSRKQNIANNYARLSELLAASGGSTFLAAIQRGAGAVNGSKAGATTMVATPAQSNPALQADADADSGANAAATTAINVHGPATPKAPQRARGTKRERPTPQVEAGGRDGALSGGTPASEAFPRVARTLRPRSADGLAAPIDFFHVSAHALGRGRRHRNKFGPSLGDLVVTSPADAEVWYRGVDHTIAWTSPNARYPEDIKVYISLYRKITRKKQVPRSACRHLR